MMRCASLRSASTIGRASAMQPLLPAPADAIAPVYSDATGAVFVNWFPAIYGQIAAEPYVNLTGFVAANMFSPRQPQIRRTAGLRGGIAREDPMRLRHHLGLLLAAVVSLPFAAHAADSIKIGF